jgi:uncharacterized membrane protein (UPF0127 family)
VSALRPIAAAAFAALACASRSPDPAPMARAVVETAAGARHVVAVEIARTGAERARGLMHRTRLAPEAGMLFLFDETAVHEFWMKDTLIPLDMIFISEDGRIVGIVESAEPLTETERSVGKPSRYVLEVNGGWAAAHGVRVGDRLRFEGVPRF